MENKDRLIHCHRPEQTKETWQLDATLNCGIEKKKKAMSEKAGEFQVKSKV